jgi:hypothetical protein
MRRLSVLSFGIRLLVNLSSLLEPAACAGNRLEKTRGPKRGPNIAHWERMRVHNYPSVNVVSTRYGLTFCLRSKRS